MFDQQMNFDKVSVENILGFLKIGGRFCITSMGARLENPINIVDLLDFPNFPQINFTSSEAS